MSNVEQIIGDYQAFVGNINQGLIEVGIERTELAMLDHICYRVETLDRYEEIKKLLGVAAVNLGEIEVAGRMIATFEMDEPLKAGGWRVPYIELPQPKDGSPYPEGLEHAEFVVIGSLDKFHDRHAALVFITKAMDRKINPELGLKTDKISVKFHMQQLGAVIGIEERLARRNDDS